MTTVGWGVLFILLFAFVLFFVWAFFIRGGWLLVAMMPFYLGRAGCVFILIDLVLTGTGIILFRKYEGALGGFGLFLVVVGVAAPIVAHRVTRK